MFFCDKVSVLDLDGYQGIQLRHFLLIRPIQKLYLVAMLTFRGSNQVCSLQEECTNLFKSIMPTTNARRGS